MSEEPIFAAPVLEFGVEGDPDAEQAIVALRTAFGAAAGLFTHDQMSDFVGQLLQWAAKGQPHHQGRSTEPEMIVARPVRVQNLALGPASETHEASLFVPVGPLRLQFVLDKRLIAGLVANLMRLEGIEPPKPN